MRNLKLDSVGLLLALATWGSAANAGLITIYGDYDSSPAGPEITYDASVVRGTLDCSIGCEGLVSSLLSGIYAADVPQLDSADGWTTDQADLFFLANNGPVSELAFINEFADPDYANATKTPTGSALTYDFTSASEYLLFKLGTDPDMFLIHNTSGQEQHYSYIGYSGLGSGLGHITLVSEPGSLSLLGAGLLSLVVLIRMRHRRLV